MSQKKGKIKTLFAVDGSLYIYPGDCTRLHIESNPQEWEQITSSSFHYMVFLQAIRDVACPRLQEEWGKSEQKYLDMLSESVVKMKKIDPMTFLKHNRDTLYKAFVDKMECSTAQLNEAIACIKSSTSNLVEVSDI